jgi:predicted metal-dependent hydrolase
MFLINLPEHLIDYVILHELVHTVHKNHMKEFWEKLESVYPGSAGFSKEIKQYQFLVLN